MTIHPSSVYHFADVELAITRASARPDLFSDKNFRESLFSLIDSKMPASDGILSLDIFDTLLLRDSSSELTRFVEIGGYMADIVDGHKLDFSGAPRAPTKRSIDAFLARHLGTKVTYRARDRVRGAAEGSLTEIHSIASRILSGTDKYQDDFIAAELSYEATRLSVNQLLLEYIDLHNKRGGRTILITDMYMHAEHVRSLLRLLNVDLNQFDLIISSADTIVSKNSGGIFCLAEEQAGAARDRYLHIGDNIKGDFQSPIQHGWKAIHLPIPRQEALKRRADHVSTAEMLKAQFFIDTDIALPRVDK
ncbi:hypothetical protein ACT6QH_12100 [Xanthobacter sp. TB0139]|uniref:hypothetical protein n=1 Tax=Xanthobacter sp. TB0139 TaxID=3459178 RepID=UPI00403923ED